MSSLPENPDRIEEGGLRTRGYYKRTDTGRPLISVITVVFNGVLHVEPAIRSVIEQSYDNVEFIIIDGGSTDGTLDIIRRYDDVVDYWVSEPDEGAYHAMNKGIKLFQGEYVLFLGCDDVLYDVFHEAVAFFKKKTASYYGSVILSNSRKKYDGRFFPLKIFKRNFPHQAVFYSKHVFEKYVFDVRYTIYADHALNLKVYPDKSLGFEYIPYVIADYNDETGISSEVDDVAFFADKPGIVKKHYPVFHYIVYMFIRAVFNKIW